MSSAGGGGGSGGGGGGSASDLPQDMDRPKPCSPHRRQAGQDADNRTGWLQSPLRVPAHCPARLFALGLVGYRQESTPMRSVQLNAAMGRVASNQGLYCRRPLPPAHETRLRPPPAHCPRLLARCRTACGVPGSLQPADRRRRSLQLSSRSMATPATLRASFRPAPAARLGSSSAARQQRLQLAPAAVRRPAATAAGSGGSDPFQGLNRNLSRTASGEWDQGEAARDGSARRQRGPPAAGAAKLKVGSAAAPCTPSSAQHPPSSAQHPPRRLLNRPEGQAGGLCAAAAPAGAREQRAVSRLPRGGEGGGRGGAGRQKGAARASGWPGAARLLSAAGPPRSFGG